MHPNTLAVWGDTNRLLKPLVLQSPFGILFSIATTGHVLYTLFTVTTSGTLSVTLHACWGQVGFTTQLWSLSFRFSGPLLGPTWLSPWCQKLCPHPFPPLPISEVWPIWGWDLHGSGPGFLSISGLTFSSGFPGPHLPASLSCLCPGGLQVP